MGMTRRFTAGAACVLALAMGVSFAQAQQPKQYVLALTVHAKPDGALDYEAFVRKVQAAADKLDLKQRMLVYQNMAGGPGYTYTTLTHFDTWAEVDGMMSAPEILTKAFGAEEAAKVLKAGRSAIESTTQGVFRYAPDISIKARTWATPPAYMQIWVTEVKPGKLHDFERVLALYKAPSEQDPGVPTVIRRVSVEGPSFTYVTAIPYNTGAERDAMPIAADVLKKALGDDTFRWLDQLRLDAIEKSTGTILHYRPDLGRVSK